MDYHPVSFLSVLSKTYEKLLINVEDFWLLEKCDFSLVPSIYGSHADFLKAISDRIARAFIRSETAHTVALDISKAFNRPSDFLYKFRSYGI